MTVVLAILLAASSVSVPLPRCAITGESTDADVEGLRVRAVPAMQGAVVGRLYPGMDPEVFYHDERPSPAEGLVGAMFTVDAVDGDWLHIADIDPVTDGLGPDGSLQPVANYQGAGWVHASKVRLIPGNSTILREQPREASKPMTGGWPADARIIACSGSWAAIRLDGNKVGWVPSRSNRARVSKIRAAVRAEAQAR